MPPTRGRFTSAPRSFWATLPHPRTRTIQEWPLTDAAAHLRHNRQGVLLADALAVPTPFVLDGVTARVVFPADGTVLRAEELVFFIPRESPSDDHELQLLLSAGEATEAAADRWRAYHGQPRFNAFGAFAIEDVKFDGQVVEEAISTPNPLTGIEGTLCKMVNADRACLAAACARITGVQLNEPLAVGVDAFGVDVKSRFGIVRLDFAAPIADRHAAEHAIAVLLGGGN
jgi:hypothetical protein